VKFEREWQAHKAECEAKRDRECRIRKSEAERQLESRKRDAYFQKRENETPGGMEGLYSWCDTDYKSSQEKREETEKRNRDNQKHIRDECTSKLIGTTFWGTIMLGILLVLGTGILAGLPIAVVCGYIVTVCAMDKGW
jgi:hypothetical protein